MNSSAYCLFTGRYTTLANLTRRPARKSKQRDKPVAPRGPYREALRAAREERKAQKDREAREREDKEEAEAKEREDRWPEYLTWARGVAEREVADRFAKSQAALRDVRDRWVARGNDYAQHSTARKECLRRAAEAEHRLSRLVPEKPRVISHPSLITPESWAAFITDSRK